jgi:heme exporter protein A
MTAALAPSPLLETATAAAAVAIHRLGKTIDQRPILRGINLDVSAGQAVAIVGANGAGKSTLLRILATLTPPTEGSVELFGQPLDKGGSAIRRRIGLISHQSLLYRDLTARENLEFFSKLFGVANPKARAMTLLDVVGLADRANDLVRTFSRGMTQRVSIARALVHRPELILADEPFAGLDVASVDVVARIINQLREIGRTVLLVDHDIQRSLELTDRVVVLRGGRVVIDRATHEVDAGEIAAEVSRS